MSPRHVLPLFALLAACGDPAAVSVEVTTGQEEGSFAADPAVTLVEIVAKSPDDTVVLQANAAPGEAFDLGEAPDTTILTFELTGKTEAGDVVARGRSTSIAIGALQNPNLPLFMQRLGGFARPPGELVRAHVHAPGGTLGEQFLVATGGEDAVGDQAASADPALGDFYDLLGLGGSETPTLARAARSLVVRGSAFILIDDNGASSQDLYTGDTADLTPPDGFEFGEVSGGLSIDDTDTGLTYVVGATRPENPTDAVMVVDASGKVTGVRLETKRAGASALYVPGVGIVVVGGATTGTGIEAIAADGVSVSSVPYPADATTGAAAAVTGEQFITVFGGRLEGAPAETRAFDLRCPAACAPTVIAGIELPKVASRGQAFALTDSVLVIGEDEPTGSGPGETLVFSVDLTTLAVTPLELRDRRRGATPIPTPSGLLAIVGGITPSGAAARSVELLFPE